MVSNQPPEVRYLTRYCAVLKREVEVTLRKQPDGSWVLVHCLQRSKPCAGHECPLHTQSDPPPFHIGRF